MLEELSIILPPKRVGLLGFINHSYHMVAPRLYHMVAISPHRFLLGNWKPGLESESQKELIGTIFMLHASNLRLE